MCFVIALSFLFCLQVTKPRYLIPSSAQIFGGRPPPSPSSSKNKHCTSGGNTAPSPQPDPRMQFSYQDLYRASDQEKIKQHILSTFQLAKLSKMLSSTYYHLLANHTAQQCKWERGRGGVWEWYSDRPTPASAWSYWHFLGIGDW